MKNINANDLNVEYILYVRHGEKTLTRCADGQGVEDVNDSPLLPDARKLAEACKKEIVNVTRLQNEEAREKIKKADQMTQLQRVKNVIDAVDQDVIAEIVKLLVGRTNNQQNQEIGHTPPPVHHHNDAPKQVKVTIRANKDKAPLPAPEDQADLSRWHGNQLYRLSKTGRVYSVAKGQLQEIRMFGVSGRYMLRDTHGKMHAFTQSEIINNYRNQEKVSTHF